MTKMNSHFCKYSLVTIIILFDLQASSAQSHFIDSIYHALGAKPTGEIRIDGRNSFLTGSKTPISGLKAGLDFDSKFIIGIGWQWIRDNRKPESYNSVISINDTLIRKTKLHYLALYAEYTFYKTKHWQFSIMPQIGMGSTYYSYEHSNNELLNSVSRKSTVFIYEPMMSGNYRITKYFGLGADLGWRFTIKNRRFVKDFLTSPIYSFHFDIYWWTIYKSIFRKNKKS